MTRVDGGFSMRTSIKPPNAGTVQETILTPPWESGRFTDAEEALAALLDYSKTIVDGERSGNDPSSQVR